MKTAARSKNVVSASVSYKKVIRYLKLSANMSIIENVYRNGWAISVFAPYADSRSNCNDYSIFYWT